MIDFHAFHEQDCTPDGHPFTLEMVCCQGPRNENQDNFLIIKPGGAACHLNSQQVTRSRISAWPDNHLRLAVLDGMGGMAAGGVLAEAAVQALLRVPPCNDPALLREAVLGVHAQVLAQAGGIGIGGCTLVIADIWLNDNRCRGVLVNVGDSRAYYANAAGAHLLTYDHRIVEFAYRDGEIVEEEYSTSMTPSNHLAQAVGFGSVRCFDRSSSNIVETLRIDLSQDLPDRLVQHADAMQFNMEADDLLVLVTDGLLAEGQFESVSLPDLAAGGNLDREMRRWEPMLRDNATGLVLRLGV